MEWWSEGCFQATDEGLRAMTGSVSFVGCRLMGVRRQTILKEDVDEQWELAAKGFCWTMGPSEQSPSPAEAFRTARMDLETTPVMEWAAALHLHRDRAHGSGSPVHCAK